MSINTNKTVPFTDVASDYMKLTQIPDNQKSSLIDFTATDFATLRESLVNYIKSAYPADYNNFVESDLGMMLVELVSYMGAIMSMKSDMLAHENFLQTAKDRDSLRKLFELVGISMKGPTSAQATSQVSIEGNSDTNLPENIVFTPSERVVVVTSPQDQEPLTYTLYKATNGVVDVLSEYGADLLLTSSNWYTGTSSTWDTVLLEGAFATQSGTFSNIDTFKTLTLEEGPVVQNSTQVFVTSDESTYAGAYREVENLYQASSTNDKVFQMVYDDDYKGKLLFGTGNNGVSPPTGASYFVTYRVGGGDRGNVPNNYVNALTTGTYNSAASSFRVVQTQIATGGSQAETVAHAKKFGPLSFKSQDRIVSLDDYIAFASRFVSPAGTTGKATAVTRKAFASANVIDLFILEKATSTQLQKASISFKNALLSDIEPKKMLTDEVVISDGLIRTLDLVVTINIDKSLQGMESTVVTKVSRLINDYFLSDNVDFGDQLVFADLNRVIFEANEVIFSTIDNFDEEIVRVDFNEIVQLNNLVINVNYV